MTMIADDSQLNFDLDKSSKLNLIWNLGTYIPQLAETVLKGASLQGILNDDREKFDLIVVDHFMNEVFNA